MSILQEIRHQRRSAQRQGINPTRLTMTPEAFIALREELKFTAIHALSSWEEGEEPWPTMVEGMAIHVGPPTMFKLD